MNTKRDRKQKKMGDRETDGPNKTVTEKEGHQIHNEIMREFNSFNVLTITVETL